MASVNKTSLREGLDALKGEFLWQMATSKLAAGRVHDWPGQGVCSTPFVEGGIGFRRAGGLGDRGL